MVVFTQLGPKADAFPNERPRFTIRHTCWSIRQKFEMLRNYKETGKVVIDIRLLAENDPVLPQVALLFEEMQAHYEVPCPPREEILSGLRNKPFGTELLVAEQNGTVSGFCSFSAIYPGPGLNPGLFLKELYVSSTCRGQGLGRSLMKQLAVLTRRRGLFRIDWTADKTNDGLLSFYDTLGGTRKTDKLFYRLDGEALDALGSEPC